MPRPLRFLGADNSSPTTVTAAPSAQQQAALDSDFVVILAALFCAIICVLGLIAVVRCAWLRRLSSAAANSRNPPLPAFPSAANKGLKKKVLRSLPKQTISADSVPKFSDCAICLTEFAAGDEIRILPQCGHGFHVSCIDMWLGSHSSCPSCRQILVVARCQKCGGVPVTTPEPASSSGGGGSESENRVKEPEDASSRFLP